MTISQDSHASPKPDEKRPDPAYLVEMLRITEAAAQHDSEKLSVFVALLIRKLRHDGFVHAAKLIERAFNRSRSRQLVPHSLGQPSEHAVRVPVDSETQMPLADLELPTFDDLNYEPDPAAQPNIESFIRLVQHRSVLLASGISMPANLLMYGPPGCGKTLAARYIASQLQLPLLTARVDAIISSYLGNTAKHLRSLFSAASSQNCILLLDEIDAVAKARDDQYELGELKRVVIGLLQNIDSSSNLVLIAATNHHHLLDQAIWRRFPTRIQFPMPTARFRSALVSRFSNAALEPWRDDLANLAGSCSVGDLQASIERSRVDAILQNHELDRVQVASDLLGVDLHGKSRDAAIRQMIRKAKQRNGRYFTNERLAALFGLTKAKVAAYR